MTERADRELLHAWLDGTLSAEEAASLSARLATDAALRAHAEELRRLAGLIASLEPAEPPPAFADRVMEGVARSDSRPAARWQPVLARINQLLGKVPRHLQQERPSGAVVRWHTGTAGGGDIVAKKALWAVAGLAVVIILGVVYFNGTRTVDQGAQGTIGGAERYRGAQPASVAANEGDVQKFLQSDTFDRIIKDKNVRHLLSDPDVCAMLGSELFAGVFKSEGGRAGFADAKATAIFRNDVFSAALEDRDALSVLKDAEFLSKLGDAELAGVWNVGAIRTAMQDREVALLLTTPAVRRALGDAALVLALNKNDKAKLSAHPELETAMANAKFRTMVQDPAFAEAARSAKFQEMVASRGFEMAVQSASFRKLVGEPAFMEAVRSASFRKLVGEPAFMEAVRSASFRKLVGDQAFAEAMLNVAFVEALNSNASFKKALQNNEALNASLKNYENK
jgi:hypothetical protein